MQTIELKDSPEIKHAILATFPNYRKQRAFLHEFGPSGKNVNSYWDGGSRSEYAIVYLPTMQRKALPTSTHPYFDVVRAGAAGSENQDIAIDARGNATLKRLPPDFALVEAGICCGKPATAAVHMNADNLTKFLPTL